MTVYLVDEPFVESALSYASGDASARIVLIQDAVYSVRRALRAVASVYAVEDDVARRGLASRLDPAVRLVSYAGLVELMENEKVVNFL
ncbi:MAG: DsrH/TusB family sulfur metabolism protein [Nitrososphaerales archaeon]|jgi:sulfur relay protein TusB/DsrH